MSAPVVVLSCLQPHQLVILLSNQLSDELDMRNFKPHVKGQTLRVMVPDAPYPRIASLLEDMAVVAGAGDEAGELSLNDISDKITKLHSGAVATIKYHRPGYEVVKRMAYAKQELLFPLLHPEMAERLPSVIPDGPGWRITKTWADWCLKLVELSWPDTDNPIEPFELIGWDGRCMPIYRCRLSEHRDTTAEDVMDRIWRLNPWLRHMVEAFYPLLKLHHLRIDDRIIGSGVSHVFTFA